MPEEVVMQPRLTVGILVLQAEGLVCAIRYLGFLFQTAPAGVVAKPNQVTVLVGHLSRDADLVAVEVVGLLAIFAFFIGPVMYLCQRFVAVGPSFFCAVFFEDFRFNQLIVQVVEIVLHFVVGQFAVDEVSEVVVVATCAVIGFQAVVLNGRAKSYLIKFIFKSHKKTSFICIQ